MTEVSWQLEPWPDKEAAFIRSIISGTFELICLDNDDLNQIANLVEKYGDMQLGATDASVIVIAEKLGINDIATLNYRHFRVVRKTNREVFNLVP